MQYYNQKITKEVKKANKKGRLKMKTFKHDGIDVSFQRSTKNFVDALIEKNISFIELPIIISEDIRILRYSVDSVTKYAVVEIIDGGEGDDWYHIFITLSVPADGWDEFYTDCHRQSNGEEPAKIKNRFRLVVDKINAEITKRKLDNCSDLFSAMLDSDYTKADWQYFANRVAMFGYSIENIDKVSEGIDKNFTSELKKYM